MNTENTIKDLPALPPIERAAIVLKSDAVAKELTALVESSKSITAITNSDGRTECHAAAMRAKAARVALEKAGKEARDDATAYSKAVIAEQGRLVAIIEPEQERLLKLRDDYDAKIEAEKETKRQEEAAKAAAITRKIDAIKAIPLNSIGESAFDIRTALSYVRGIEIDDSYGDQFGAAKEARGDVILKLVDMADAAEQREAEAARAAEEKRIAEEKAAKERAEQEAEAKRLREENERIRAENAAEQARLKAEADRIRAENEAAAAKLKADRDAFEKQQAEAAEEKRQAEERERIRQEEVARIERENAERARKEEAAEQAAAQKLLVAPTYAPAALAPAVTESPAMPASAPTAFVETTISMTDKMANGNHVQIPFMRQPATDTGARLKLGEICAMLGFNVTADFLAERGFQPVATDKAAKLYRASDFPAICAAISRHVANVGANYVLRAA